MEAGTELKTLDDIRAQLVAGHFLYTEHAYGRSIVRSITRSEIVEASSSLIMIEDYPDDKYGPSCLLLGYSDGQRPLHLQVSLAEQDETLIITL